MADDPNFEQKLLQELSDIAEALIALNETLRRFAKSAFSVPLPALRGRAAETAPPD